MGKYLNSWQGRGRLTATPEMKFTPQGQAVVSFSIACNKSYKAPGSDEWQEKVEFVSCVAWGRDAEVINLSFDTGNEILILDGEIMTRSWDDKDTGAKRYKTEVTVRDFVKCEKLTYPEREEGAEAQQRGKPAAQAPARRTTQAPTRKPAPDPDPDEDELPF